MNKKERTEMETIVKTTKTWKTEAVHIGMLNISKQNCIEIMTRDIFFKCEIAMEKNKKSLEKNIRFYPMYCPVTTRTKIKIDNYSIIGDDKGRDITLSIENENKAWNPIISVETEEEKLYEDLIIKVYDEIIKCIECEEYRSKSILGNKNDVKSVEEHKKNENK